MKMKTRIQSVAVALSVLLGGLVVTSSALACPSCPDGYVASYEQQMVPWFEGIVFEQGDEAWSPANQNDPDAPGVLGVQLKNAWCIAAFDASYSCYVEQASGDTAVWRETDTCPSTRANNDADFIAFAMYCAPQ